MGFFGYLFEKINGDNFVVLLLLLLLKLKKNIFSLFNIKKFNL